MVIRSLALFSSYPRHSRRSSHSHAAAPAAGRVCAGVTTAREDQLPAAPLLVSRMRSSAGAVCVPGLGGAPAVPCQRESSDWNWHETRLSRLMPTAAHFLTPGVLLLGVVVVFSVSRAAADAYASELRKRGANPKSQISNPNPKTTIRNCYFFKSAYRAAIALLTSSPSWIVGASVRFHTTLSSRTGIMKIGPAIGR